MLRKLTKNDFIKSVSILMSGTLISQAINYGFTPILSRIYSVEEMGDLGLFFRIVAFIVGLSTARYELSLPLPKNNQHSFLLYRISIQIALYVLLCAGIIGVVYILKIGFSWYYFAFLALVILGSLFTVLTNLGTNWAIRMNQFKIISSSRMINALLSNLLKLGLGFLKWGSIGLLIGTVVAYFFSSIQFLKEYLSNKRSFRHVYSKKKQRVLVKEYRHFPMVNLPHSLSDFGRDLLIAFLVVFYFGREAFGHYSFAMLILNVPVGLIGISIGQVFFNKVSKMLNDGETIYPLVVKTMKSLLLISIVPFTILYFFSEDIFSIVLGEKWRLAGTYAKIMVAYNFLNFLVSPLSNLSFVLNRQKEMFISALVNSSGQVLLLFVLPLIFKEIDFVRILWILTIFQSIMMLINVILYLKYAKHGKKQLN